jgi:hypothetical protein
VLVDARTPAEAVVAHPTPAAVIKDGNVVARNSMNSGGLVGS